MPSIELKPLFEKKSDPLTLLMKDIFKDNNYALSTMGVLALGLGVAQSSDLKADDAIEDIVVTASQTFRKSSGCSYECSGHRCSRT